MPRPARKTARPAKAAKPPQPNTPVRSKRLAAKQSNENTSPHTPPTAQPVSPHTPAANASPCYGRRSPAHRRVSFPPADRRASSGRLFDDLIDGLSPIKPTVPAPEMDLVLDGADELPALDEVLEKRESRGSRTRGQAAAVASPEPARLDESKEPEPKQPDEDSASSDDFDIDALVVRSSKKQRAGARAKPARVADAERLPQRRRAQSEAPQKPRKTPGKQTPARAAKKRRTYVASDSDASDAAPKRRKRQPKKKNGVKRDAETGDIWAVDAGFARYFDDIDGFELAEEN
ncbi:hypothetical protein IWW51_005776, partial [Coemansia sp. RSA 2702]